MKKIVLVLCAMVTIIACSSSDDSGNPSGTNNYDRTALLTNWADNLIIPAFENYQSKVADLAEKSTAFTASPTAENLSILRDSWVEAYKAYQYVSMYYIGKAEQVFLKESANTYPTDVAGINSNIANGGYNLATYAQFTRQGFPGLDYLINGLGADGDTIIGFYTANGNAAKYKQYLNDVAQRLKTNADAIVNDWNSGYRQTFIAANGTTVSSSVNKMTNLFVKNLERDVRTAKVGIPSGQFSNGITYPEKVEAYYKGNIGRLLLVHSLHATADFFNGKHFGSDAKGESLKTYLDYVNAIRNGDKLSNIINNQFGAIEVKVAGLNENFAQQINTNNSQMTAAYNEIQKNVIYTKLDMMQALNITIDYVDGDGD